MRVLSTEKYIIAGKNAAIVSQTVAFVMWGYSVKRSLAYLKKMIFFIIQELNGT